MMYELRRHYSSFDSNVGLNLQYNISGFLITEITAKLKNTGNKTQRLRTLTLAFFSLSLA